VATRLTAKELMDRLMQQSASAPVPSPQMVPWLYQDDPVGPPAPPRPPVRNGLDIHALETYQKRKDQSYGERLAAAPGDIVDWAFPEHYQKEIEQQLPDWLGPAKPFVAGALDFDTSDFMNPIAAAPIKGTKAALKGGKKAAKSLADEYINFSKMGLSDEGEAGLRGLIEKYAQAPAEVPGALPNPKAVLPDAAVRADANKIDLESLFLLETPKPGSGGFNEATSLALRDAIKSRMGDLERFTASSQGAVDEATKTMSLAQAAAAENDIARLVGIQTGARAEAGRGLRVWRQIAEETTDPGFWLGRATQKAGGRLPGDKALELNGILKQIADATDDKAKSLGKLALAKWMNQFEEHGVIDVALAFRKAGLVSGIKSHARNLGGNALFAATREVSQIPEYIADVAFSMFSKQSTIAPPGLNVHRGMHAAATQGLKEAWEVRKYGTTLDAAKKFDLGYGELNSKVFGGGKIDKAINGWVNGNFRVLGAEDKIFRSYAFQRALDDGARTRAKTMQLQNKLPSGESVSSYAKQLAANPPKDLTADAMYAADYAVLANKNKLASWINSGKQSGQAMRVSLDLVMPYVTTPTNIIARTIEYTPLNTALEVGKAQGSAVRAVWDGTRNGRSIKEAHKMIAESFTPEQQKALSQAIGRGATGSALMYMGYTMASKGTMTGFPAESPGERAIDMASGKQPMSYKTPDGEWRKFNEYAPAAPLLITGASMYENSTREMDDESKRSSLLLKGAIRGLKDLPLLQGTETIDRVMESPATAPKAYLREQLGTWVPTIVADFARGADDKVRTTYLKGAGVLDSVKERLPGLRKDLPALRDAFGDEVKSDIRHTYDPGMPRKESGDRVRTEMERLGMGLTKPRQEDEQSNEDYLLEQEVVGKMIHKDLAPLMNSPGWESKPDELKKLIVERIVRRNKNAYQGKPAPFLRLVKRRLLK